LWSVADGSQLPELRGRAGKVHCVVFCGPDRLATGGADNVIRIWDLAASAESARLVGHEGTISALSWQAEQNLLVSGSFDTTVRLWQLPTAAAASTAARPTNPIE
jgi:WD40 repeat protein